jgi:hypothetical protein
VWRVISNSINVASKEKIIDEKFFEWYICLQNIFNWMLAQQLAEFIWNSAKHTRRQTQMYEFNLVRFEQLCNQIEYEIGLNVGGLSITFANILGLEKVLNTFVEIGWLEKAVNWWMIVLWTSKEHENLI